MTMMEYIHIYHTTFGMYEHVCAYTPTLQIAQLVERGIVVGFGFGFGFSLSLSCRPPQVAGSIPALEKETIWRYRYGTMFALDPQCEGHIVP